MALDMGAAAGGAEMLQQVLARKLQEQQVLAQQKFAQAKLAEDVRQANMQNQVQQGNLALGGRRVDEDVRQFDAGAPLRLAQQGHLGAETTELQRRPQAEQAARDFELTRDTANHTFASGENEKGRSNAVRIANINGVNSMNVARENNKTRLDIAENKPATEGQTNLGLYANRVEQSAPILKKLETSIAAMNPASFAAQTYVDNPKLQSDDIQSYQQASRNFINAVLRRESGAAISPSEFAEARKQYLPVPGDSDQVRAQKTQNRQTVFDNFKRGAGPAYQPAPGLTDGGADVAAAQEYDYVPGKGLVPRGK